MTHQQAHNRGKSAGAGIVASEKDFQAQIIELAQIYGWLVHAERPAWTSKGWRTPIQGTEGFPDMVLVRRGTIAEYGRLIFAEVKGLKGKVSEAQREWNSYLVHTQAEVYTWRVGKITIEEIVEILR